MKGLVLPFFRNGWGELKPRLLCLIILNIVEKLLNNPKRELMMHKEFNLNNGKILISRTKVVDCNDGLGYSCGICILIFRR
ncbi:hypothetical protein [Pelotomaculum schinkii]|uniref:hypothetical protein n=1 Tax=Pelotomaculum schinkii TaxID=78350 RepID=UPI00167D655B|nr:hypothetical protein [Pelotomaculum schinkii]